VTESEPFEDIVDLKIKERVHQVLVDKRTEMCRSAVLGVIFLVGLHMYGCATGTYVSYFYLLLVFSP
jgi:hypothetical protein